MATSPLRLRWFSDWHDLQAISVTLLNVEVRRAPTRVVLCAQWIDRQLGGNRGVVCHTARSSWDPRHIAVPHNLSPRLRPEEGNCQGSMNRARWPLAALPNHRSSQMAVVISRWVNAWNRLSVTPDHIHDSSQCTNSCHPRECTKRKRVGCAARISSVPQTSAGCKRRLFVVSYAI
jgi:hypothetical protein